MYGSEKVKYNTGVHHLKSVTAFIESLLFIS